MIAELRALLAKHEGPRGSGRTHAMLCGALSHQGLAGSVWVVAGDVFNAERLGKMFVALAKEGGHTGTIKNRGRQVVIGPTSYHFITLGEDGNLRGVESPRLIDHSTLAWAIRNLIRENADAGGF